MQDMDTAAHSSGMTHHQWLSQEPFTLAMSAGFFGFFAHAGLLRALERAHIKPRRVVGVSAGALAGGVVAAGVPISELQRALVTLRREDFWDPGLPFVGLLKGKKFEAMLDDLLEPSGIKRLEDCPTPFNPVVFDLLSRDTVVLERGSLNAGIRASCALPVLFRPVRVNGRWCIDGGVRDRPGITGIAEKERVLVHFLVSSSPWRHFFPSSNVLAQADHRRSLVVPDLPRVTPWALQRGPHAVGVVYDAVMRWLEEPLAL